MTLDGTGYASPRPVTVMMHPEVQGIPKPRSCRGMKTAKEYRQCHIQKLERSGVKLSSHKASDLACTSDKIRTWEGIQNCVNGPRKYHHRSSTSPLEKQEKHLHLIGERNSGTKFVIEEIKSCFPPDRYNMKIHRDYLRPKHFFQPIDMATRSRSMENHYVVSIFRSPVEWVAAMIEKPYHSPSHVRFDESSQPMPLAWQDFVNRPWTLQHYNQTDHDWQDHILPQKRETRNCRYGFGFQEIIPCRWIGANSTIPKHFWRAYEPIYELRTDRTAIRAPAGGGELRDGVPFDNIMQLRSEKIKNFLLEVPLIHRVGGYHAVRYEDLLANGTRAMLEQVATILGLPGIPDSCNPQLPAPDRRRRKIPDGLRQWVEDNLILETERLLGYR